MPGVEVKAVVFDAVGTLIHPNPAAVAVYAAAGRRHGSRLEPAMIATRFRAAFQDEERTDRQNGLRTSEARERQRWRHIVAAVLDDVADPAACFEELFQHFAQPAAWRCTPEAAAVLRALAERGYVLGVASNYDSRLRSVVAGLPELAPVRHLVISSEVGWRKPAGAFFAAVVAHTGVPAAQVLLVGDDRVNDCEGAAAAGLQAILFDPRGRETGPAQARIERLSQLLDRLPGVSG